MTDTGIGAVELRSCLLGEWSPDAGWLEQADLNHDGVVNVADLVVLLNAANGQDR
ncbi:MAG: hypothetical protein M1457_14055 [bacterium]|nr:hypothetical protein [bacterium]